MRYLWMCIVIAVVLPAAAPWQTDRNHQIDEHTFLSMKESQVEKLIPLIGPQTLFLEKRSEYLKNLKDSQLIQLLKTCERTQVLLSSVRLTPRDRRTLCGIIVDHLLSKKEKVTACDFNFWANQIPLVFRHELAASYYQPYRGGPNKRLASGKLWDRYNNEKKHIRPQKTASSSGQRSVASRPVLTEEIEAALVKLRAISPEDTEVRNLWRLTAGYREKEVSISDYYQQYPILGTTIGSSLIHIDFEAAGLVSDPNILIKTWADTARLILKLAKQRRICKDLFDRRVPRLYGDRIPTRVLTPSNKKVQRKIVLYHNFFRTRVTPTAANMLVMKWHNGAAKAAQQWAEACYALTHDNATGRHIDAFGSCGQNIFISTAQVPWFFAIKTWYLEHQLFKYGPRAKNDLSKVGHYTQMVWAPTHRVGCGWAKCSGARGPRGRPYFSYVCNYCPAGNHVDKVGTPYVAGPACSSCEGHCRLGKLCKNACPWADLWANCRQLYDTWPSWLCESDTQQGLERRQFCRATCRCRDKIV